MSTSRYNALYTVYKFKGASACALTPAPGGPTRGSFNYRRQRHPPGPRTPHSKNCVPSRASQKKKNLKNDAKCVTFPT